jgi:uncharacterized membrane protein YdjX (TVP38/TMEM64 family)
VVALSPPARAAVKLLALVVVLGAGAWFLAQGQWAWLTSPRELVDRVSALSGAWWAPIVFVGAYAVLAALNFSGLVLTLLGGAVFGVGWGTVLNTLGANLGATGAYWLARGLGRDGVRYLAGDRLAAVDRFAVAGGFPWLLRLRLIPVVPFNLLNLAGGLAAMPWPRFAAATAIGILPGTFVYTWFADALVAGSREASREALLQVAIAGGALILLSFVPWIVRRLRRAPAG